MLTRYTVMARCLTVFHGANEGINCFDVKKWGRMGLGSAAIVADQDISKA